jgi:hypothetical protein
MVDLSIPDFCMVVVVDIFVVVVITVDDVVTVVEPFGFFGARITNCNSRTRVIARIINTVERMQVILI